ncbi:MAG: hydroxylamine reductase [Armatimonadota bacterium]
MYCYQCEQTKDGVACTVRGVCGKDETTAAMQDMLMVVAEGLAHWGRLAYEVGQAPSAEAQQGLIDALFTAVTNVSFDPERLAIQVAELTVLRNQTRAKYEQAAVNAGLKPLPAPAICEVVPGDSIEKMVSQVAVLAIEARVASLGDVLAGLVETCVYGLKGTAAYAHHAARLGSEDAGLNAKFFELLDRSMAPNPTADDLLGIALEVGALNLKVMELLDSANTGVYGHPVPTKVRVTPVKGKAIVVSGHDLRDLADLLEQTEGLGINIYTHGEMLPAHGYPELNKYKHLVGNYGGAWQLQVREFSQFPGAVLMTTNCIQDPSPVYKGRIFTTGMVAFPGVQHVAGRDFSAVIKAALEADGFVNDAPEQFITVGFGHNAVLGVADVVIDAVKAGAIKHFFLVGGCDGARAGRNYYTKLAEQIPQDCVILTLACGKFRFNKLEFGDIGGIPRLLDMGQCNDAYSAIRVAVALSEAFGCSVNELPLSMILSWYEQKAVAILLTLLHLGIKDIRLGPSLPAFIKPAALQVLVDAFDIKPITTPEQDIATVLAK